MYEPYEQKKNIIHIVCVTYPPLAIVIEPRVWPSGCVSRSEKINWRKKRVKLTAQFEFGERGLCLCG